jgi:hypothetical protein
MDINEVRRMLNDSDIYVRVNGELGFITSASRVGNDWFLSVSDADTRVSIGQLKVPVDGLVEVVRVDR